MTFREWCVANGKSPLLVNIATTGRKAGSDEITMIAVADPESDEPPIYRYILTLADLGESVTYTGITSDILDELGMGRDNAAAWLTECFAQADLLVCYADTFTEKFLRADFEDVPLPGDGAVVDVVRLAKLKETSEGLPGMLRDPGAMCAALKQMTSFRGHGSWSVDSLVARVRGSTEDLEKLLLLQGCRNKAETKIHLLKMLYREFA